MKVSELILALGDYDPDMEVVWAVDDEGNAFHTLQSIGGTMSITSDSLGDYKVEQAWSEEDGGYGGESVTVLCIN